MPRPIRKRGRKAGPDKALRKVYKMACVVFAKHRTALEASKALGIKVTTYTKWYRWWLKKEAKRLPQIPDLKPKERRKVLELLALYKKLNTEGRAAVRGYIDDGTDSPKPKQ